MLYSVVYFWERGVPDFNPPEEKRFKNHKWFTMRALRKKTLIV